MVGPRLRTKLGNLDLIPNSDYGDDANVFSLKVHHGGHLVRKNFTLYIGGKVDYYDNCDCDMLGILDISDIPKELGYVGLVVIYYRVPGRGLSDGLKSLATDNDVLNMVKVLPPTKVIELYLDHIEYEDIFDNEQPPPSNLNEGGQCSKKPRVKENFVENDVGFAAYGEKENDEQARSRDSDESHSDFHDSNYAMTDDDEMYEQFIDTDIEWGGVDAEVMKAHDRKKEINLNPDDFEVSDEDTELSHDIRSRDGSDDESEMCHEFNANTDMTNVVFQRYMIFGNANELREAVRAYGRQQRRAVSFKKNNSKKISVWCRKGVGCTWALYAAKMQGVDNFQVRTFKDNHQCGKVFDSRWVNADWLAQEYVDQVRLNPEWPLSAFQSLVKKDHTINVTRSKVYRAKKKAEVLAEGSVMEQYALLNDYCEELKRVDPDTTISMLYDETSRKFLRLYICFGATKKEFMAGCRKVIGLDACHMKGTNYMQIMSCVGVDANNCQYPVAWAIVESECSDTWNWFLELLVEDVNIENDRAWTFISDKQKGLRNALSRVVPRAEHRFCVQHLYDNFRIVHKGKTLKDQLKRAAQATTVQEFSRQMGKLNEMDDKAFQWVCKDKHPREWSRSHFQTYSKCDIMSNNLCESFNRNILPARDKPIITCFESIRCMMMKRLRVRREAMRKWPGKLCPNIVKKLEQNKQESGGAQSSHSGQGMFQVFYNGQMYSVDIEHHTCSCRKWNLTGIPCLHAVSAIYENVEHPEDYVHECYTKEAYMKAYEPIIMPINGSDMWPTSGKPPILPPDFRKQPGRTKKLRKKGPLEAEEEQEGSNTEKKKKGKGKKTTMCSKCLTLGHNIRRCENPPHPDVIAKANKRKKKATEASKSSNIPQSQPNPVPTQHQSSHQQVNTNANVFHVHMPQSGSPRATTIARSCDMMRQSDGMVQSSVGSGSMSRPPPDSTPIMPPGTRPYWNGRTSQPTRKVYFNPSNPSKGWPSQN